MLPSSAKRMTNVEFSKIREISAKAAERANSGHDVFRLTLGEPDFDTPAIAQAAAFEAIKAGDTHYTPNTGIPELREALANKLTRENGIPAKAEEIIVTNGGSEALFDTFLALLNPGDEVIIPSPAWPNYDSAAHMAGATPVHIPMESENGKFISPIEQIETSITPNTKILVVNTPHNPTGVVLSKEELQELANLATKHNLIVVSDEMYEKIIADETPHYSIASFPGMAERTITINGFSKAYAMTGWRVGYLHAPTAYYPAIFRVHQFNTACTPGFAQQAALTLLKNGERAVTEMKESFQRRRVLLQSALEKAANLTVMEATGAIYLFVHVRHNESNIRDFALRLLDETGVACVPGTAFGNAGEGYLRLSYATSEEDLLEAAKRLVAYVG
ncbi:hypothetical protein DH09_18035 [Bacillaceae bacterium JMAK1]|nr:hypothetical protein DH09_18035 [Bacillaceae bacterium JMAK1]